MFVIGFSRSSYISDFQSLPYSSLPHYVFTLLIGFAQISGSSSGLVGGSYPSLFAPVATLMFEMIECPVKCQYMQWVN